MHPPPSPPLSQGMGALLDLAIAWENPPGPLTQGAGSSATLAWPEHPAQGEVWLLKAGLVAKAFLFLIGLGCEEP